MNFELAFTALFVALAYWTRHRFLYAIAALTLILVGLDIVETYGMHFGIPIWMLAIYCVYRAADRWIPF